MSKDKITKADLIEGTSDLTGLTKKSVNVVLHQLLGQMKSALSSNKAIELRGFGTFEIRSRKARDNARNPKTGAKVQVEQHGVVTFRPGKELKETTWSLG